MTVCIAARSQGMLLLASDRMITAGDIEFEPPVKKVILLTKSIAVMYSGDSSIHSEVVQELLVDVDLRVKQAPTNWLRVRDVANLYIQHWNAAKSRRAESVVLAPVGLTLTDYLNRQNALASDFVRKTRDDLINFEMPPLSVVIAGIDVRFGSAIPSIYTISNAEYSPCLDLACADEAGFAAIGIGANHAESQFMQARYSRNEPNGEALLLLWSAKKAAEVAPGVGKETDILAIGPDVGRSFEIVDPLKARVDALYLEIKRKEEDARTSGRAEINRYLAEISQSPPQTQPTTLGGDAKTPENPENNTVTT